MYTKLASIDFGQNKDVSIALDKYIEADGMEYKIGRDRRAFIPGEIEQVKEYTGLTDESPEIVYINSIWTQEVIDNYQNLIAQNEE